MSVLEIKLFGPLRLVRDGQSLARFPSQHVKYLLGYLLLNRQSLQRREHVASLFWGHLEPIKARHCLNTALWRLHRVLNQSDPDAKPYLLVDAQTIGFNPDSQFQLDVAEFETRCVWAEQVGAHAPEQQAAFYRQAVHLYRADLLTDCYEDWCLVERERLQQMYLRALSRLYSYHTARGEYAEAIDAANRILECDPLREEIHRDLMRLHLAVAQPTAALQQYRTCSAILERELGIEPMPETQALLAEVLGAAGAIVVPQSGVNAATRSTPATPAANGIDLADALAQLRAATVACEAARTQLQQAAAIVTAAMEQNRTSLPPHSTDS